MRPTEDFEKIRGKNFCNFPFNFWFWEVFRDKTTLGVQRVTFFGLVEGISFLSNCGNDIVFSALCNFLRKKILFVQGVSPPRYWLSTGKASDELKAPSSAL